VKLLRHKEKDKIIVKWLQAWPENRSWQKFNYSAGKCAFGMDKFGSSWHFRVRVIMLLFADGSHCCRWFLLWPGL
jgi:predicted 3-demethylubiquinone-9 3-methyltransferase (glyoxalase superfamily)